MMQGEWVDADRCLVLVRSMGGSMPNMYGVCQATPLGEDVFGSLYLFKDTHIVRIEGENGTYRFGVADPPMRNIRWSDDGEEWKKMEGGTMNLRSEGKRKFSVSWSKGKERSKMHATAQQAKCLLYRPYVPLTYLLCMLLGKAVSTMRAAFTRMAPCEPLKSSGVSPARA